jgi:hypothetical protein
MKNLDQCELGENVPSTILHTKIAEKIPETPLCCQLVDMQITKNTLKFSPAEISSRADPTVQISAAVEKRDPKFNKLF